VDSRWGLDEFDARAVENDVLIDLGDRAADHSPIYYYRALTKCETKIVEGIGLEGESAFDLDAATANAFDRERLQHITSP
jgi:hypothetical protein